MVKPVFFAPSSTGKTQTILKVVPKGTSTTSRSLTSLIKSKKKYRAYYDNKKWEKVLLRSAYVIGEITIGMSPIGSSFGIDTIQNILRSSQVINDDFITQLPSNISTTFRNLGLSNPNANELLNTLDKIQNFLRSENIEFSLNTGPFVDPEYPDWMEIKIILKISGDFDSVYSHVRSQVYQIVGNNTSDELYDKLIIKIEPM